MDNNLNYECLCTPVLFFRNGKAYYYSFNGKIDEVNTRTINRLKENLSIPFKVQFSGLSKAQIGSVIECLSDDTMDVKVDEINAETEVTFTRKKEYVEVYKVPNVSSLYGRTTNCNPFLYTTINSRKVLMEVSKDDVKGNIENCYFLSCELDLLEKEFFDSLYTKLECDYVYKLEKNLKRKLKKINN